VKVEPGREVTLGRSPECSMQLPAAGASRRHASIGWRGARVVLRDLGSTNGTFLNGERVEEETRTVASYWPPAGAVASETLRGDLAKVPMFAVLQMLEMGSQTGCLAVETPEGEGWMWLERGRLVHAECAKASGFEAALVLAQAGVGCLDFAPGSPTPERSFGASVTELILEATRLLDEASVC
jgi:hypothetical protein